jgi:hypothetical protein
MRLPQPFKGRTLEARQALQHSFQGAAPPTIERPLPPLLDNQRHYGAEHAED